MIFLVTIIILNIEDKIDQWNVSKIWLRMWFGIIGLSSLIAIILLILYNYNFEKFIVWVKKIINNIGILESHRIYNILDIVCLHSICSYIFYTIFY